MPEQEEFKSHCIKLLEICLDSVQKQKARPEAAPMKDYYDGFESGLKFAMEEIKKLK